MERCDRLQPRPHLGTSPPGLMQRIALRDMSWIANILSSSCSGLAITPKKSGFGHRPIRPERIDRTTRISSEYAHAAARLELVMASGLGHDERLRLPESHDTVVVGPASSTSTRTRIRRKAAK